MESGWVINYKNGEHIIYSERKYAELVRPVETDGHIDSCEHWFDMKTAIEKNPALKVIK